MNVMTEAQIAWVAGILEGEGYFLLGHKTAGNGTVYPFFQIRLNMTDRDIVDRMASIVGVGCLRGPLPIYQPHHKPAWSWTINKREDIHALCTQLLPWMGERRGGRIMEMLAAYEASKPKEHEHGTRARYERDGCRCEACRAANNKRQRAYYGKNKDKYEVYRHRVKERKAGRMPPRFDSAHPKSTGRIPRSRQDLPLSPALVC